MSSATCIAAEGAARIGVTRLDGPVGEVAYMYVFDAVVTVAPEKPAVAR